MSDHEPRRHIAGWVRRGRLAAIGVERTSSKTRNGSFVAAVAAGLIAALLAMAGVRPADAAFPGVNGKIAFMSTRDDPAGEIYVMNSDGSNVVRLTDDPMRQDIQPAWSPDGARIAFASDRGIPNGPYEIYVMNADGTDVVRLTHSGGFEPAWSPDGTRIAFTAFAAGTADADVYVMNADGSGVTRLTFSPGSDLAAAWSPEGSRIAFTSFRDGNANIYVMNPDGSGVARLTEDPAWDVQADWSPDGTKLMFTRGGPDVSDASNVYVMNADGSGITALTGDGMSLGDGWSPDGARIVFRSFRDGNFEIYVMNADGSLPVRLTDHPAQDRHADWQPLPPDADTDGDGLTNAEEADLGTDPLISDTDGDGLSDGFEVTHGTDPLSGDSDRDGIGDARDVEAVQAAVGSLPIGAFQPPGGGTQNAIINILNDVEAKIAAGEIEEALALLNNLRRHVDGCGTSPDRNDWIVDCTAQAAVRALVDMLIADLST